MSIAHVIMLVYCIIAAIIAVITAVMVVIAEIQDRRAGIINYDKKLVSILGYFITLILAVLLIAVIWPAIILFIVKPIKEEDNGQ